MSTISSKKIDHTYKDQYRWNRVYGKELLEVMAVNPTSFNLDNLWLSESQKDLLSIINAQIENSSERLKILDFGSGRGEFSIFMAKLGAQVVGIDIGSDLIKLARKIALQNKADCTFVQGNINDLPFDNEEFDIVVGCTILHHLPILGVKSSLSEAYRVLKPGGTAYFTEPIENNPFLDYLQNLVPVGNPADSNYRPSILQKSAWKKYLDEADDRALSNKELEQAKGYFKSVKFRYYGMFIRLQRLWKNHYFTLLLKAIDRYTTHPLSPINKLSQSVLVTYYKGEEN